MLRRTPKSTKTKGCPKCHATIPEAKFEDHAARKCPGLKRPKKAKDAEIFDLQAAARESGRTWVHLPCATCGSETPIHVDWYKPLILCKGCRADRKVQLRDSHAKQNAGAALTPKMPSSGRSVPGGLPSSGKRR